MKEASKDLKSRKAADDEVRAAAGDNLRLVLPTAVAAELPATQEWPTAAVHPSHRVVMAGGHAGCWRCGSVAGHKHSKMLAGVRRGLTAEGAEDPVRKLARGVLPLVSASASDTNGDGVLSIAGPTCQLAPRVERGDPAEEEFERAKKKRRGVEVAGSEQSSQ